MFMAAFVGFIFGAATVVAYTQLRTRLDYVAPAKVSALESEVAEFYKNRK